MPEASYFMAFGGLGLSLAGYASIISALRPQGNDAIHAYRIRNIVLLGFSLTFVGFGTVAVYSVTGANPAATARFGTLIVAVPFIRGLLVDTRPGPAWPVDRERRVAVATALAMLVLTLGNLVAGSVGYLQLLMLLLLIGPVSIFYNTIRDATAVDGDATTTRSR